MYGGDILAIERKGKPFLCANVGMMWMSLALLVTTDEEVQRNAKRLYEQFGTGDPGEYEMTLEELIASKNADCKLIIPETKDRFISLEHWLEGNMESSFPTAENRAKGLRKENEKQQKALS